MEDSQELVGHCRKDSFLSTRYELHEQLGSGCFGQIFRATNKKTLGTVALKVQLIKSAKEEPTTLNEAKIMLKLEGKLGVPRVFGFGSWPRGAFMELQILQTNLKQTKRYNSAAIVELTLQLISILEVVHAQNIIHQDIKPQNLMRSHDGNLYLIDFGLARVLPGERTAAHAAKGFTGTPRYASIQAHACMQQSKKDDLESAFYNLAFLYYQRLPWTRLEVSSSQKLAAIKKLKMKHNKTLFNGMPAQFKIAFDYICSLHPYAQPNYNYLKTLFRSHPFLLFNHPLNSYRTAARSTKRPSLSMSYFLQTPEIQCPRRKRYLRDETIEKTVGQQHQQNDSGFESDRAVNSLNSSKVQEPSLTQILSYEVGDFEQEQNAEPHLPESVRFGGRIVLKNPFYYDYQ